MADAVIEAPFVTSFQGQAAEQHAKTSVCGLWSDVERNNIAAMAYRLGQSRLPLQGFIGWDAWDDDPLRPGLISQVKTHVGQADGVLGCEPSGLPKSGRESVGGARQWCGRLGQVDPCPVAISLGDVSRKGHTLVDTRLDLPKAWTQEKARLDKADVPNARRGFRTRHPLALERLAASGASPTYAPTRPRCAWASSASSSSGRTGCRACCARTACASACRPSAARYSANHWWAVT